MPKSNLTLSVARKKISQLKRENAKLNEAIKQIRTEVLAMAFEIRASQENDTEKYNYAYGC